MIWEGIAFSINFSMLLVYLTKSYLDSPITMWIIQIVVHLLASIFCYKLLKGLQAKNATSLNQGKKAFIGFSCFECGYFLYWLIFCLKYEQFASPLFYVSLVAVPALAFLYIVHNCSKLEKLAGGSSLVPNNLVSVA